MKKTSYADGAIVYKDEFYKKAIYDISNNVLTAQFDGRGNISKYAVVNKWDFIFDYYNLFEIGGNIIDFMIPKTVTMIGKRQTVEFETPDASVKIIQFADVENNAIFQEFEVLAKTDTTFKSVFNLQLELENYIFNLFAARFSLKNFGKFLGGTLKKTITGRIKEEEGEDYKIIRSDPWGECYVDVAMSKPCDSLDKNPFYAHQFSLQMELKAGEKKSAKMVLSMGTRNDFSHFEVREGLQNFDKYKNRSEEYIKNLPSPPACDTEFLKSYYKNLYNCSLSMYKQVGEFKGFLAGIVYQSPARTYFRDGYWTILSILPERPELVRDEIITLSKGINKDGKCPSAVKYNFKNYWGDHYDSPSFFAIMLYDYVKHTGDADILKEKWRKGTILDAAIKVVEKLSEYADDTSLLYKGGEYNRRDWCDNVFREGYVTYDEALYARALFALSQLTKDTDKSLSKSYYDKYIKVKDAINSILWDDKLGYYVNYKDENFTEDNLSIDTVITILFGIADAEKSKRILTNMENILESKNNKEQKAGDFGVLSVYPFYKKAEAAISKSSYPYYYHNGGDWPYWSAIYAYAKMMYGMEYMYPLTRWFEYNIEKGNFTPVEFFAPPHKDGSLLQAWSSTGAFVLSYPKGDFFK